MGYEYKYFMFDEEPFSGLYFRVGQNCSAYQSLGSDRKWRHSRFVMNQYVRDGYYDYYEITDSELLKTLESYEELNPRPY